MPRLGRHRVYSPLTTSTKTGHQTAGDFCGLRTKKSFTVYAVGSISHIDQQDFHGRQEVRYFAGHDAALEAARTLSPPSGRIYLLDLDTGLWSEIPKSPT